MKYALTSLLKNSDLRKSVRTTLCLTLLLCSANGCAGLHNSELQRTFWALLSSEQLQGMDRTNALDAPRAGADAVPEAAVNEVGAARTDFDRTLEKITKIRDALAGGRGADAIEVSRQVIPGLPSLK